MTAATITRPYRDGFEHLTDHLHALDRRIGRLVTLHRRTLRHRPGLDARNHILISDTEVDRLLCADPRHPDASGEPEPDRDTALETRTEASLQAGVRLPFEDLRRTFGLGTFEMHALIVCLAPELDRKYDRLFAYLQDDITRKRPSIDLVVNLLCASPAERWQARTRLCPDAPLLAGGILRVVDDPASPSGTSDLARFLRLDDRIRWYLHGVETVDGAVSDAVTLLRPAGGLDDVLVEPELKSRVWALVTSQLGNGQANRLVLGLHGPAGVGRRALAEGICAELGCSLVHVDTRGWLGRERHLPGLLRLAFREGLLHQGMVYLDHVDALLRMAERESDGLLATIGHTAAEYGPLTFIATREPLPVDDPPPGVLFQLVEVPRPGVTLRSAAWQRALADTWPEAEPGWVHQLAGQFTLTPRQIAAAVRDAGLAVAGRPLGQRPGIDDLRAACRRQCEHQLSGLATKVPARRSWSDLILPAPQVDQLTELCSQVRHQATVLDDWGFGRVMSRARGLSALLVGVPGTGKTMATEVIAGELGVDLFAIDLSAVVSKYIGETEKNLATIFRAAEHSNAILFFDEADALFGKRTDVSNAHDRYANIETSFLLQKMEQYDGVVVLATNLRENMDEAFTRRLRFVIEFPFPDEPSRAAIWRSHFSLAAKFASDIDVDVISRQYPLSGAGIRNATLTAAFAAAEDGSVISLSHIRHGIRREYEKIGKLWTEPTPVRLPLNGNRGG